MGEIVFKNICKHFGDTKIIDNLDLTIKDGEFTVLVGPSGCGKTTLLRMIAGIGPATSGELYIDDEEISDVPPGKRGIAMVFQNYAITKGSRLHYRRSSGQLGRNLHFKSNQIKMRCRLTAHLFLFRCQNLGDLIVNHVGDGAFVAGAYVGVAVCDGGVGRAECIIRTVQHRHVVLCVAYADEDLFAQPFLQCTGGTKLGNTLCVDVQDPGSGTEHFDLVTVLFFQKLDCIVKHL